MSAKEWPPPVGTVVTVTGRCCGEVIYNRAFSWDGKPRQVAAYGHGGPWCHPTFTAAWTVTTEAAS